MDNTEQDLPFKTNERINVRPFAVARCRCSRGSSMQPCRVGSVGEATVDYGSALIAHDSSGLLWGLSAEAENWSSLFLCLVLYSATSTDHGQI